MLPFVIVAFALGVGVFAAINVAGRLAEPGDSPIVSAARPAATTGGSQGQQPAPAGQATAGNQATQPASPPQTQFVRITNTGGEGAFLRRTTNLDDRLRAWADNTRLRVLGPDTNVNGTLWRQVEDPAGNQGWIPAQYTQPES